MVLGMVRVISSLLIKYNVVKKLEDWIFQNFGLLMRPLTKTFEKGEGRILKNCHFERF